MRKYINIFFSIVLITLPCISHGPTKNINRAELAKLILEILFRTILKEKMGTDISENIALLSRDFFRIESAAMVKTYADFETYVKEQKEFQSGVDSQSQPIMEQPQTMVTAQDGNTYAIMRLHVKGPMPEGWLESETSAHTNILLMATFDANKKLLAFDWYNYFSSPTNGYFFRLIEANNSQLAIEIWNSLPSGLNGLAYTKKFVLEDVR